MQERLLYAIEVELIATKRDRNHDLKAINNFLALAIENDLVPHLALRKLLRKYLDDLSMEVVGVYNEHRLPKDLLERRLIFAYEAGL